MCIFELFNKHSQQLGELLFVLIKIGATFHLFDANLLFILDPESVLAKIQLGRFCLFRFLFLAFRGVLVSHA